jgi:hypothetical protein
MDSQSRLLQINILDIQFNEFMASQSRLEYQEDDRPVSGLQDGTY